jgi:hypothetical protein
VYGLFDGRFREEIRKLCCKGISKIDLWNPMKGIGPCICYAPLY